MFNPDPADMGGTVGFVFGGLCVPCIAFLWWYQPETKDRWYEELDEMFIKKVPARKFGQLCHRGADSESTGHCRVEEILGLLYRE